MLYLPAPATVKPEYHIQNMSNRYVGTIILSFHASDASYLILKAPIQGNSKIIIQFHMFIKKYLVSLQSCDRPTYQ
jgi:hypothetical protein